MASTDYIRWDDPKVEPACEDEDLKTEELTQIITGLSHNHFSAHRHASRVTHVKTQGIAKGTLTVLPNLPAHLAQGLFASSKEYPVGLRFANEPIFLQDDRAPGPRGVGMKIFNVDDAAGEFMDDIGSSTKTHDMTFNNAPVLELKDVSTCLEIFRLRYKYYHDPSALDAELKKRPDADLQMAPKQLPNRHFLSYTMYSQAAYRYGDYICKFALFPATRKQQEELKERFEITERSHVEQHSRWLQDFFLDHEAEFDLRVQLCRDLDDQPVEDASVEWDEGKFPFETVARLIVPRGQDVFGHERRIFWDDGMKLNPWYGLRAHQPLGSVNRLRKTVYQASLNARSRTNARAPKAVSSIDEIP